MSARAQEQPNDSGDDSDIQEIAVIEAPRSSRPRLHDDDDGDSNDGQVSGGRRGSNVPAPKRRKSSPQMDPIPTYSPTPLHILEQRKRGGVASDESGLNNNLITYSPTKSTAAYSESPSSRRLSHGSPEYEPLLQPSPCVVGRPTPTTTTTPTRRLTPSTTNPPRRSGSSSAVPRPVSSALAQAVARRRNSQQESAATAAAAAATTLTKSAATKSVSALRPSESLAYAEEPVMWSPQLPSQIKVPDSSDDEKYKSPRPAKQRVAHKPTVPVNKHNRPKVPSGPSKIPLVMRAKYLEVLTDEYLNTGHEENESYQSALREEQTIASRTGNKNIYVNLVAGLKKKIREQAGISTKPPDTGPEYVNGKRLVSHEEILIGKVKGTFSIERKRKLSDPAELGEYELYDRLLRYLVPLDQLEAYGYPSRDPDNPELRKVLPGKDGHKLQLREQLAVSYTCERCTKVYRVEEDGMQTSTTGKCIFHPGHIWNQRINRALEKRYSCCKGDPSAGGCSSNPYHVHRGEHELENYRGYVETQAKPQWDPNKHGVYALDCEMCYTTYGLELTRVTVINYKYDVVYERLVKPKNPILDYNTKFSGIKQGDLDDVKTTIVDVQQDLLDIFSSNTILVGHSLDSDMKALKIFHKRFIDTAQLFPHKKGLPFKRALRTLMVENLRVIIQEDVGHDSKEDASAAFRLVMWKAKTDVPPKA